MLTVLLTPEAGRPRETWGTGWGTGPFPSTARQLGWVGTAHAVQRPALLRSTCIASPWPPFQMGQMQGPRSLSLVSVARARPVKSSLLSASLSRSPKSTSHPGTTQLPRSQRPRPPHHHSTCSQRATPLSSPAAVLGAKAGALYFLLRRRVSALVAEGLWGVRGRWGARGLCV